MKRINSLIFAFLVMANPMSLCADGGHVAAGLIGGTALGMIAGTALANSNSRSKSDRVEDKLEQLKMQREQDEKLEQVRRETQSRQDLERRLQEQEQARMHDRVNNHSESSVLYMLIGLIFLLLLGVVGLAVIVFRGKNNDYRRF